MRARVTSWTAVAIVAGARGGGRGPGGRPARAPRPAAEAGLGHAERPDHHARRSGPPGPSVTTTLTGVTFGGAALRLGLRSPRHDPAGARTAEPRGPQLSSPLPDEEVSDIEFVSPTTGWAIGVNNAILRTHERRRQLVVAGLLPARSTRPTCSTLSAVDATHAWIGGYYTSSPSYVPQRRAAHDGRHELADVGQPPSLDGAGGWGVTGLDFPDRLHGWAAISGGYYAFSNDGGAVWTPPIDVSTRLLLQRRELRRRDPRLGRRRGLLLQRLHHAHRERRRIGTGRPTASTLPEVRAVFAVSQSVAWAACADGYVLKTDGRRSDLGLRAGRRREST